MLLLLRLFFFCGSVRDVIVDFVGGVRDVVVGGLIFGVISVGVLVCDVVVALECYWCCFLMLVLLLLVLLLALLLLVLVLVCCWLVRAGRGWQWPGVVLPDWRLESPGSCLQQAETSSHLQLPRETSSGQSSDVTTTSTSTSITITTNNNTTTTTITITINPDVTKIINNCGLASLLFYSRLFYIWTSPLKSFNNHNQISSLLYFQFSFVTSLLCINPS